MRARIVLVKKLNEGLAVIEYDGDQALWAGAKLRKPKACAVTGRMMSVGTEALRPMGNQMYRMERIDTAVLQGAVDGATL